MSRIAFVTYAQLPALTADDRVAVAALRARGHDVDAVVWDDAGVAWASFEAIVLRSCWDYHRQPEVFAAWLDARAQSGANLQNPAALARWNMEKTYLRDLAQQGIAIVPTRWIEPGTFQSLAALRRETGWTDLVLKPAISATAWRLWRMGAADQLLPSDAHQALDERLFMAQPYVPEIEQGEWSLIFFDGRFSHAVLKQARAGDFRVQEEYGGRSTAAVADAALVLAGERILAALAEPPLYARVDGVLAPEGFVLLELELLEPHLFFATAPLAGQRFADALERRLGAR